MNSVSSVFHTNFGASGASIFLVIENEEDEIPVTALVMSYALNEIPSASVTVPLGFDSNNAASLAYKQFEIQNTLRKAKVVLKIPANLPSSLNNETVFNSGEFVLFVGYITGYSHRRHIQNLSLVVSLRNPLIGLTMSSAASTDVLPGTPDTLVQSVGTPGSGINNTWADRFTRGLGGKLVNGYGAILDLLTDMAKNTDIVPRLDNVVRNTIRTNGRAIEAISGDGGDWGGFNRDTEYPLILGSGMYTLVEAFILNQLTRFKTAHSFWDILIGKINPHFGVHVIPTASQAFLAPVVNLAKNPHFTITTKDLADINIAATALKPIRGAIVYGKYRFSSLSSNSQEPQAAKYAYDAYKDGDPSNFFLFIPFPQWMSGWEQSDTLGGANKIHQIITNVINTASNAFQPGNQANNPVAWDPRQTLQNYAKYIYSTEVMRGRSGTLVSRLRFDICPGMTIKIEGNNPPEIKLTSKELVSDSYGLVNRVTTTINSQEMTAITYLELSEVRSEKENDATNRFSMEEHPFFENKFFKGEHLVPGITK